MNMIDYVSIERKLNEKECLLHIIKIGTMGNKMIFLAIIKTFSLSSHRINKFAFQQVVTVFIQYIMC